MCYHVSQQKKDAGFSPNPLSYIELENTFNARFEYPEVFKPAFHLNGFEHGNLYCIPQEYSDAIEPMRWGFVEKQAEKDAYFDHRIEEVTDMQAYWRKKGGYTLNGQVERVFDYYVTAEAIRYRRCLIPITGFFESKHVGKEKLPYFIHPKDNGYFALAGIYNENETGLFTCKILTTAANPLMAEIHNSKKRMPVMLHPENWDAYISDSLSDTDIKAILSKDTNQEIETYTVSKDVNNSRIGSNRADILASVNY